MAPGTWLAMAASVWGHWCHGGCPCVTGEAVPALPCQPGAAVQQTGSGALPALPSPQDRRCREAGGRHVVRLWLLPRLETLVGGGNIESP